MKPIAKKGKTTPLPTFPIDFLSLLVPLLLVFPGWTAHSGGQSLHGPNYLSQPYCASSVDKANAARFPQPALLT